MSTIKNVRYLLFIFVLIFNLFVFEPVILGDNSLSKMLTLFLHKPFSLICHQQHDKLITINNASTLVCARCAGIYLGGLLGNIYLFFRRSNYTRMKLFVLASLPMLLDVVFYSIGLYNYSKIIAFSTGLIFGFFMMLVMFNGIENFLSENK